MDEEELSMALAQLDQSQGNLRTLFLALAMQYKALDMERCKLLSAGDGPEAFRPCPDTREVQTAASLITLCALFGFLGQSEYLALQESLRGGCPDMMGVKLGAAAVLLALLRLVRLQQQDPGALQGRGSLPEQQEEELEALGESLEDADV